MPTNEEWKKIVAAVDHSKLVSSVSVSSISLSSSYSTLNLTYELGQFETYYSLYDEFSFSEIFIHVLNKQVLEPVVLLDITSFSVNRSIADNFGVADEAELSVAYVRQAAESISTADLPPVFDLTYTRQDIAVLTENTATAVGKLATDQLTGLDQHSFELSRPAADGFAATDFFAYEAEYLRSFEDASAPVDAIEQFDVSKATSDSAEVLDLFSISAAYFRAAEEVVSATDSVSSIAVGLQPQDIVGPQDSLSFVATFYRSFNDVVSLVDTPTVSNVVDALGLGDDYSLALSRGFADTTTLADLASISSVYSPPESAALSDSSDLEFGLTKAEGLVATDVFQATVIYSRAFSDAFAVDDTAGVGSDNQATKQNVLFMSEEHSQDFSKTLADNFTFSDVFSRAVSYERTAAESLSLSETVQIFKVSEGSSVLNGGALNTVALNN
jgi:hypothetical protein